MIEKLKEIPIDFSKLTKIEYWLDGIINVPGTSIVTPALERNGFHFWFFASVFSTIFIFGVLANIYRSFLHVDHPLQSKIPFWSSYFSWLGIFGSSWLLFRQTEIMYLGSRVFIIFWGIGFLTIIGIIINYLTRFYPLEIKFFKKNIKQNN